MLQVEAKIGEYTELLLIKSSRALLAMPDHFVIHDDVHSGFGRCAHGADWRVKECMLRNHMILPDGRYRHSVLYSILDTEWADVKKKLEAMLER